METKDTRGDDEEDLPRQGPGDPGPRDRRPGDPGPGNRGPGDPGPGDRGLGDWGLETWGLGIWGLGIRGLGIGAGWKRRHALGKPFRNPKPKRDFSHIQSREGKSANNLRLLLTVSYQTISIVG